MPGSHNRNPCSSIQEKERFKKSLKIYVLKEDMGGNAVSPHISTTFFCFSSGLRRKRKLRVGWGCSHRDFSNRVPPVNPRETDSNHYQLNSYPVKLSSISTTGGGACLTSLSSSLDSTEARRWQGHAANPSSLQFHGSACLEATSFTSTTREITLIAPSVLAWWSSSSQGSRRMVRGCPVGCSTEVYKNQ